MRRFKQSGVVFLLVFVLAFAWHAAGGLNRVGGGGSVSAGDSNGDGKLDVSDAIHTLRFLFSDGPPPAACQSSDVVASDVAFDSTGSKLRSADVNAALLELDSKVEALVPGGGSTEVDLIEIPAGSFVMGSPSGLPDWSERETRHRVTLTKAFKLGRTEITQAQYSAVLRSNPSHFIGCPDCPVEGVSWYDAREFCRILTASHLQQEKIPAGARYRLPTESEWEYACRAGATTRYYFGEGLDCVDENAFCPSADEHLWYGGNDSASDPGPQPVAQKKANAWGLHDMLGNVFEYCEDWYGPYPQGNVTDPKGPAVGSARVARGGSWDRPLGFARCAGWRLETSTFSRNERNIGFRIVLELP